MGPLISFSYVVQKGQSLAIVFEGGKFIDGCLSIVRKMGVGLCVTISFLFFSCFLIFCCWVLMFKFLNEYMKHPLCTGFMGSYTQQFGLKDEE